MQNKDWGKSYEDYSNSGVFSKEQLEKIKLACDSTLNHLQVEMLAKAELSPLQMELIRVGYEKGFVYVQVKRLTQPGLTEEDMDLIMKESEALIESQKHILF
ncbi:MAG: hypothetical protein RR385_08600 [Clostridiales bacterium]